MIIRGMNVLLIIACIVIVLALIIFPLIVDYINEAINLRDDVVVDNIKKIKKTSITRNL